MSDEIKPISLSYMWLLVTRGGEALTKDIRPDFKPEYRNPLIAKGLIKIEPAGRSKNVALTDAGWGFLASHMTDSVKPAKASTSGNVAQGLLEMMHRYMQTNEVTLAELASPKLKANPPVEKPGEKTDISKVVKEAVPDRSLWSRLSNSWGQLQEADDGIRLEKLRSAFADVSREHLDQALIEWQRQGKIVIYPYDDGERITPEVKEGALKVNGRDLHIIYLK